jgi:hypothetical protein
VSNNWGSETPTSSVYFEKLGGDTNWQAVCRSGGLQTRIDTGVPGIANVWHKFEISKISGVIRFKIDEQIVANIDTNVPNTTELVHFGNNIRPLTATSYSYDIDYFSAIIKTIPR